MSCFKNNSASLIIEQLETRDCFCGCGATFKCLPSSPQRFACRACEELGPPRGDPFRGLKRRGRKRKNPPLKSV
jgi:hypothetical protein